MAQARLFRQALDRLGIDEAIVLGHSWGTLVAVALALDAPSRVRGLVLAAGYYYPTPRADVLFASVPAVPVIGDGMRYTVAPLAARLIYPRLIRKIFSPAPVPERFRRLFPKEMALRPSQLRAAAEDSALMIPAAAELRHRYGELEMPVVIVAGTEDRIVDPGRQSGRLHRDLPRSEFIALPGGSHMVHHLAPDQMASAVDRAALRPAGRRSAP
jgi:pimeloyl-ACP methyl ester carboxylesterase